MMTLFVKTGCPFCARVLASLSTHNVPFEEKNIADQAVADELIALGGKRQVPFMVDGDTMMYESLAIVEYIEATYATEAGQSKPKIHFAKGTDLCQS